MVPEFYRPSEVATIASRCELESVTNALSLPAIGRPLEMIERAPAAPGPDDAVIDVRAAGICHSDEHYRSGRSMSIRPPIVLGHEVAGVIAAVGANVSAARVGERACVHYVVSCGRCAACARGDEQFCTSYAMIGNTRDGGYAESIVVPAVNALPLPDRVSFAQGAVLMCAGGTAMHALRRARFKAGESVAVLGVGGIGMFAVQIARALGAREVFAIDRDPAKLAAATSSGARAIDANDGDAARRVLELTDDAGVDVAVEAIGLPVTIRQALEMLAIHGRAVVAGIAGNAVEVDTYRNLLGRETELLGSNDHLRSELVELLDLAARGLVGLGPSLLREVPFSAESANDVLGELREYRAPVRTVMVR
jgi:2-desacetyl-2-hydroxyethyl bacteriochlorophyllide A dehydrogenase